MKKMKIIQIQTKIMNNLINLIIINKIQTKNMLNNKMKKKNQILIFRKKMNSLIN